MKRYIVILLAILLVGCGKDGGMGPQGPQGPTGSQGQNGLNGTNALNNVKTYIDISAVPSGTTTITVDNIVGDPPLFVAFWCTPNAPTVWYSASVTQITSNTVTVSHTNCNTRVIVYQITSLN